eukprot:TRINITY_DN16529_c0_g1_i1.p1 TRINITY_DN16529_c0_g1~~TRINITY_DN16529_c0_g1_i1.p1  ORF type:complete len:236 (+),score=16.26 TRINITY_DN16529_c0_g1_i1:86-793(+)
MIRRPPRSTLSSSSAASDVYKRQEYGDGHLHVMAQGARQYQAYLDELDGRNKRVHLRASRAARPPQRPIPPQTPAPRPTAQPHVPAPPQVREYNDHTYGRSEPGWMLRSGTVAPHSPVFHKTVMTPILTDTSLTDRVLRSPYQNARDLPESGPAMHYGVDHRKRFPYILDHSCGEIAPPPGRAATVFDHHSVDLAENSPWRSPVRVAPEIRSSALEHRGILYLSLIHISEPTRPY